jgi:hypothetical protein
MSVKVKLQLNRKSVEDKLALGNGVAAAMTGNANFPTPAPALTVITGLTASIQAKLDERAALDTQRQALTTQINAEEDQLDEALTAVGNYAENQANQLGSAGNPAAAILQGGGFEVAGTPSPIGPMPKVTGLSGTAGDEAGEVDLHWNPVRDGLKVYVAQTTSDPAASTGWNYIPLAKPGQSKASLPGFTSATRQWFRIAAQGSAGQGPWSDPVQVTIP